MGLKPDHWIKRMAKEQNMIEPFVEEQVRGGVISYGVSSYGYDVRIADEFKIFTNVFSAVVDPKNFDPQSMVDFKGAVCIIPPNSFVLARTVEYFRIPDNVLTICVGKCVAGDTRIVDGETGAYLPVSEAANMRRTVGMDRWQMRAVAVSDFIPNGVKPVYELTTKMGLKIRATANHPFRQLTGWTPLANLKPGDRIAATRYIPVFGQTPLPEWEATLLGLMIAKGQCHTSEDGPVFTASDPVLVELFETCIRDGLDGEISHDGHAGYRAMNRHGRGSIAGDDRAYLWSQDYGLNVAAKDKFVPQAIFMAPKEAVAVFLRALFSGGGAIYSSGEGFYLEYCSNSSRLIDDIHHLLLRFGIVSLIRQKKTQAITVVYRIQITDREQILRFAAELGFWYGSEKQTRLEEEIMPLLEKRLVRQASSSNFLLQESWGTLHQAAAQVGKSLYSSGISHAQPGQSLTYTTATPTAIATHHSEFPGGPVDGPVWDVVNSIRYVGEEAVYDLTVPATHNFVANDLIVHNSTYARCGLIVNVTPFEPGWEGYVTLEISNTTPLPAKIYANEGISQVLFFEGDEPCEITYADRKGKYQKQQSIVLPKV